MNPNKPKHRTHKSASRFLNTLFLRLKKIRNRAKLGAGIPAMAWVGVFILSLQGFTFKSNDILGFKVEFSNPNPQIGDTMEIIFTADIPAQYHLYSEKSNCPEDDGPLRAEWTWDETPGIVTLGKTYGIDDIMIQDDEVFKCSTGVFTNRCVFRQKIVITGSVHQFQAHFTGQKCSEDGTCYLVKEDVNIPLHLH